MFGGWGEDWKELNSVEMFSQETNQFVMMAPMKIARDDFACCRIGKHVYVVGGRIFGVDETRSVEIYNMDTDIWTDGVDFPVAEHLLHACVVNNKLPQ